MSWKYITGIIAIVLMLAFLIPIAYKLKELSLVVVICIGLTMMLVDMFQTMKSSEH